jgi:uncharacterized repeat protein (TIGR01451 family)
MTMAKGWYTALVLSALAVCALADKAIAADPGCIVVQNVGEIEQTTTDTNGVKSVKLVPAVKVVPGDTVIYTVKFRNTCDKPADNVSVDNPVPEHMAYVAGSAVGPNTEVTFSTDGGYNFAKAEALRKKDSDGTERAARASEYTNIRWVMRHALAADAEGFARFLAVLE